MGLKHGYQLVQVVDEVVAVVGEAPVEESKGACSIDVVCKLRRSAQLCLAFWTSKSAIVFESTIW